MGPYSHIVIASKLETTIRPDNLQEYYWGAVAPDIRYLVTGMSRSETHIPVEKILDYQVQHPQLKAFLQGYLVHCLSDQYDLPLIVQQKFPFSLQKKKLTPQQCSIILEFYNIERVKHVQKTVSGRGNILLSELGIDGENAGKFAQAINIYANAPSLESIVELYQNLGLVGDDRIKYYRAAVQHFQSTWLKKNLILLGLQAGRVDREITTLVKSSLPAIP